MAIIAAPAHARKNIFARLKRETPPIIAANITSISALALKNLVASKVSDITKIPPMPAINPATVYVNVLIRSTFKPHNLEDSSLPPTAKICRPTTVKRNIK